MARKKLKVARYMFNLNEREDATLRKMMDEDQKTEISGYIGYLIVEVYKARQEARNARKPGRPRKDSEQGSSAYEEEEPRNIPHPDQIMNKGRFMTLTEYEAYNEIHNRGPQ